MKHSRRPPRREVEDIEFLRALGRMMKAASARLASSDVEAFVVLAEVEETADQLLVDAVRGLRESGLTWQEIGDAAGTTRQAAHQRWARKVDQVVDQRQAG